MNKTADTVQQKKTAITDHERMPIELTINIINWTRCQDKRQHMQQEQQTHDEHHCAATEQKPMIIKVCKVKYGWRYYDVAN